MKYIIPKYIQIEKSKKYCILKHPLNDTQVKISEKKYYDELEDIIKYGCTSIKSELTKFLYDNEILFKEREIDNISVKMKTMLDSILKITIMPTEACNFRCIYCYEDHNAAYLSEKQINNIKTFILDKIKSHNIVSLNWFGGEPTLCKEKILDVNRTILENLPDGKEFVSNMTTNGYLLSVKDFIDYYNVGIRDYQITIDGFIHDKTRFLTNGNPTFSIIMNNLREISKLDKSNYKFNIVLRNNITKDNNDLSWYDFIKKSFNNDDRFKILVRTVGDWGGTEVKNMTNLVDNIEQQSYLKLHVDYANSIGLKTMNSDKYLGKNMCYAGFKNSYIFRGNGKIEKCTMSLDHPLNCIGIIDDEKGVQIDEELNKKWTEFTLESKCLECTGLITCFNHTCPKKRIIDNNYDVNCNEIINNVF